MKFAISFLLLLTCILRMDAQVLEIQNQDVSPKYGIDRLAVKYYGIDFSREQRKVLEGVEIEFIYSIDINGSPTLLEINGIKNQDIMDSLRSKTKEVGRFNPQIRNGIAEPSMYFMKLTFPAYRFIRRQFGMLQETAYNEARLEDFDYLIPSGQRYDLTIGGLVNQFIGNPYLGFGGGMKIDLCYAGKNNLLYGLNMSFYGNKQKKEYPIKSTRELLEAPSTLLLGFLFGKWFNTFSMQGEISLGVQNVTKKVGENDPDMVQLKVWGPGLNLNYPIKLGKPNPLYYYGSPSLLENNLDLHVGLRYLKFSLKEASGLMAEFGVSYRMAIKGVSRYKLKDEFINK